jgi:dTDP-4-amino-4,6-dideoxygalactose transaminase
MSEKSQTPPATAIPPQSNQGFSASDKCVLLEILETATLTQEPLSERFEAALAKSVEAQFAVVFASGTAALHAAVHVSGLKPDEDAITSPISFVDSANAILYNDGHPIFADINPESGQITAATIAHILTRKTKVIIPVDLCGRPSELAAIQELARKHEIVVIQNAAHSLGARYKTRHKGKDVWAPVGSCYHADMCCFSLAEGGAVTTNNQDYYDRLIRFREHGITKNPTEFQHQRFAGRSWYSEQQELGFNYQPNNWSCARGLSQLKTLNEEVCLRARMAARYRDQLADDVEFLRGDDAFHKSTHHLAPILVDPALRDVIFEQLRSFGIGVQLHYIPIYRHPYYQKIFGGLNTDHTPHAESYFRSAISLPIYPQLTDDELMRVIEAVKLSINKAREKAHIPSWGEAAPTP